MWHVDEGALHAYLDGALEEYPAAEARRVREHVETCAECAERLTAERRVRQEAERILALAAPAVAVPSFEELRAYVRASQAPRTAISVRLYKLGWAASVVLALGTGWILRGGEVGSSPSLDALRAPAAGAEAERSNEMVVGAGPAERAASPSAEAQQAPAADRLELAEAIATTPAGSLPSDASAPPAPSAVGAQSRAATGSRALSEPARQATAGFADAADRDEVASAADDEVAADLAAPPQPSALARGLGPAAAGAGTGVPEPLPLAPNSPDGTPEVEEVAAARADANQAGQLSGGRDADVRRRAAAEQRITSVITADPAIGAARARSQAAADLPAEAEATSLVVPGLEVLDVLPVGEGATFAGMRALQRLEAGDTLELVHLPQGVDPSSLTPLREGWSELVRQRGSGWLVMRAPVAEAFLLELLQRLEAGR